MILKKITIGICFFSLATSGFSDAADVAATTAQTGVIVGLHAETFAEMVKQAAQYAQMISTGEQIYQNAVMTFEQISQQVKTIEEQWKFAQAMAKDLSEMRIKNPREFVQWVNQAADTWESFKDIEVPWEGIKFGGATIDLAHPKSTFDAVQKDIQNEYESNADFEGLRKFGFNNAVVKNMQDVDNTVAEAKFTEMKLVLSMEEWTKEVDDLGIMLRKKGKEDPNKPETKLTDQQNKQLQLKNSESMLQFTRLQMEKIKLDATKEMATAISDDAKKGYKDLLNLMDYYESKDLSANEIRQLLTFFPGGGESSSDFLPKPKQGVVKTMPTATAELVIQGEERGVENLDMKDLNLFQTYLQKFIDDLNQK